MFRATACFQVLLCRTFTRDEAAAVEFNHCSIVAYMLFRTCCSGKTDRTLEKTTALHGPALFSVQVVRLEFLCEQTRSRRKRKQLLRAHKYAYITMTPLLKHLIRRLRLAAAASFPLSTRWHRCTFWRLSSSRCREHSPYLQVTKEKDEGQEECWRPLHTVCFIAHRDEHEHHRCAIIL